MARCLRRRALRLVTRPPGCVAGALSVPILCLTALALVSAVPVQAQPLSEERERAIRVELDAFFDQYYGRWARPGGADVLAERAYTAPLIVGNGLGPQTPEAVREWLAGGFETLSAQGWVRSDMPNRDTCVLNDGFALVSGHGVRYRQDGSVLGEYGWTYVMTRTAQGWRIASALVHALDDVIRCGADQVR